MLNPTTVAQAEGFVESHLERLTLQPEPDEVEYAAQLDQWWQILIQGMQEQRQEIIRLQQKINHAKIVLG